MMTIRDLPDQTPKVDTGLVRFGKERPGVFIGWSDIYRFVLAIKIANNFVEDYSKYDKFYEDHAESLTLLCNLLESTYGRDD
jgi:hypothetical protein